MSRAAFIVGLFLAAIIGLANLASGAGFLKAYALALFSLLFIMTLAHLLNRHQ